MNENDDLIEVTRATPITAGGRLSGPNDRLAKARAALMPHIMNMERFAEYEAARESAAAENAEADARVAKLNLEVFRDQDDFAEQIGRELAEAREEIKMLREAMSPILAYADLTDARHFLREIANNALVDHPCWTARHALRDYSWADLPSAPEWFKEEAARAALESGASDGEADDGK